jgi:pimeloyl-ACP methyl ester carboxylesterase
MAARCLCEPVEADKYQPAPWRGSPLQCEPTGQLAASLEELEHDAVILSREGVPRESAMCGRNGYGSTAKSNRLMSELPPGVRAVLDHAHATARPTPPPTRRRPASATTDTSAASCRPAGGSADLRCVARRSDRVHHHGRGQREEPDRDVEGLEHHERLGDIRTPTLVLSGRYDEGTPAGRSTPRTGHPRREMGHLRGSPATAPHRAEGRVPSGAARVSRRPRPLTRQTWAEPRNLSA